MLTRQQLVKSSKKVSRGTNPATSITIHETANRSRGADAAAHANLQTKGNVRSASWHWSVDEHEAVQSFLHTTRCWHAGTTAGNNTSIGIEICVNADGDYAQAVRNAAELTRRIMIAENIPLKSVVQHGYWSGKDCPTILRNGSGGITWNGFLHLVSGTPPTPVKNPVQPPKSGGKRPTVTPLVPDGVWGSLTTAQLQRCLATPVDGIVSNQLAANRRGNPGLGGGWDWTGRVGDGGSTVVKALQLRLGVKADGYVGRITISALQRYLGTPRDGVVSYPSTMVKALQRRLNTGRL